MNISYTKVGDYLLPNLKIVDKREEKGINKNGGDAQLKICYGVRHNAWDYAYKGDELYTWLLSHTRKQAE